MRFGVVPIENSTEGVVNPTLIICGLSFADLRGGDDKISHHVLSKASKLEDVKVVYSHPHAIAQCRNWLETNLPAVPIAEEPSTARAAERCFMIIRREPSPQNWLLNCRVDHPSCPD